MAGKLLQELKQKKPFENVEEEVILNIARTAEYLISATAPLFKSVELTPTQYNALRILRGAGENGLSCSEVSERMITRESDITRLLDRLENSGWITRERPSTNRRIVIARITESGLNLLSLLDGPLIDGHRRLVGHLSREKLVQLIELLEEIRTPEDEN